MRRISIIYLVVCLVLTSGCHICCWGKRTSEKNCPTDIRQTHCWCFGEDAIFHCPCGPDQAFYGYQPTCWREWPASGAAWRDAYCPPVVTPVVPGGLESQAPSVEGPVIMPGGELPEPLPITPPPSDAPMLPPQGSAIEGNNNPPSVEFMSPASNHPGTLPAAEAVPGANTVPDANTVPSTEAAPGAEVVPEAGAAPNLDAAPGSESAPGAEAAPGNGAIPSAAYSPGTEVAAPVQFGLPTPNALKEPHELPPSEENDEQPLKESWWHSEPHELQQSVHLRSGETVEPAYYRTQSDPTGTKAERRPKPEIRRLPPI